MKLAKKLWILAIGLCGAAIVLNMLDASIFFLPFGFGMWVFGILFGMGWYKK